jgi:rod shape-determining protein MreC
VSQDFKKIFSLTGIFILFLFLYHLHFLSFFDRGFLDFIPYLGANAVKAGESISLSLRTISSSRKSLLERNKKLLSEINELNLQILRLKEVDRENIALRELLKFQELTNYNLLVADVIYKSNLELERAIVINKGARDGIKVGGAVVIDKGTLIGKIIKVTPYKSTALLTVDRNSNISATLEQSQSTAAGILNGLHGASLELNLISKDINIFSGQRVMTNGLQNNIPPDLFLGTVIQLKESENEIFNSALVRPPYSVEDLKTVAVIID